MEKTKIIGLMGCSLKTGNQGVSALIASLVKIFSTVIEDNINFKLFIGNRDNQSQFLLVNNKNIELEVVNCRLSPKSKISQHIAFIIFLSFLYKFLPFKPFRTLIRKNYWIDQLLKADFVGDIRGGDSFSDIYGLLRFIVGSLPSLSAILVNKELVLLPQTYGPYKSIIAKLIAGYILKHADIIISRDNQSILILREILGNFYKLKKIIISPDVAFMLDSIKPEKISIRPAVSLKNLGSVIGLNISGLLYNGGYDRKNMFNLKIDYKDFIIELIENLLKDTKSKLLLIPHTYGTPGSVNSDSDACNEILSFFSSTPFKNKIFLINEKYNQNEIKGIIGSCDFFIGSRMHSCIAALSQGIPTIGIAYSKKFSGVFNSIGYQELVLDATVLDTDKAIIQVFDLYNRFKDKKGEILQKIDIAKKNLITIFKNITF